MNWRGWSFLTKNRLNLPKLDHRNADTAISEIHKETISFFLLRGKTISSDSDPNPVASA
jgi:hypothetical protein